MKKILPLILATLLCLPAACPAKASGELYIAELMYDAPGSDAGHEWVELYNPGPASVPIVFGSGAGSWRFSDGSSHVLRLAQGAPEVPAGGFLVVTASSSAFLAQYPSYSGTLATSSISLPNAGATIGFTADGGLSWLAQLHYDSAWGGAGDGSSLEKVDVQGPDDSSNWRSSPLPGGTPGQLPTPPPPNHPPVAVANANRFTLVNRLATFDASQSSDPDSDALTYVWDFGDGATASGIVVEHAFVVPGPYEVLLAVSDGLATATDTVAVNALAEAQVEDGQPPVARLSGNQSGAIGQILSFSAADSSDDDGDELQFIWDFGDGTGASGVTTSHAFAELGSFTVSVTVSDGSASSSAQMGVEIFGGALQAPLPVAASSSVGPTSVGTVVISELLPNPVGDDRAGEYIELQNTGSSPVQLGPWALVDSRGKVHPLHAIATADVALDPGAYLVVPRLESGISLGNASGTIQLLRWDGSVADTALYGVAPEGKSWSQLASGSWAWAAPTPGAANAASATAKGTPASVRDLAEAGVAPKVLGASSTAPAISVADPAEVTGQVEMTGVVSVVPGIAGKRLLYVSDFDSQLQQPDGSAGILVNVTSGVVPGLKVGDVVLVRGDIGQSGAERQIKVNKFGSITTIGHADFKSPDQATADDLSPESVGSLVAVGGEVTKNAGKLVTVDDGTGEIVVAFPSNGSVPKPKIKSGQTLAVVGVVRAAADGSLRVMPRLADEVVVSDAPEATATAPGASGKSAPSGSALAIPGPSSSPLLPVGLAGAGVALGGVVWWVRRTK